MPWEEYTYEDREEQLHRLPQGVDAWNRWRQDHPLVFVGLHHADLFGVNLSGYNLSRAYLTGINLSGANLSGAVLDTRRTASCHADEG